MKNFTNFYKILKYSRAKKLKFSTLQNFLFPTPSCIFLQNMLYWKKKQKGWKYHEQTIYHRGGGYKSSYSKGFSDFNYHGFINFCLNFFNKTLAFTLAETLIVMGIIGVVAALTLPNLNSSTGDKEKVAKVKKVYSNFEWCNGQGNCSIWSL